MASEPYFTGIESPFTAFKGEVTRAGPDRRDRRTDNEGRRPGHRHPGDEGSQSPTPSRKKGWRGRCIYASRVREHLTNHHETNAKEPLESVCWRSSSKPTLLQPQGPIAQQLQLLQELQMQAAYRGQDQDPVQPRADSRTRGCANLAAKAFSLKPSPRSRDSRPMTPMCRPSSRSWRMCG